MDQDQIARALNEWMRIYTQEPETHDREFQVVVDQFLKEKAEGTEPSYGKIFAAYLFELHQKLAAD